MTLFQYLKRLRHKRQITLRLLLSHCIRLSVNVRGHYLLKYDYHHNETRESDILDNILRVCLFSVQLENFIQENVRSGMEEMKRTAVHTQTAAMLEMGTNLLSQSAEQTRKLTDVETQVSPTGSVWVSLRQLVCSQSKWTTVGVTPMQKQMMSLAKHLANS